MSASVRSSTTYTQAAHATSTLTLSKPAGTEKNDLLVAAIALEHSVASLTAPAGWTTVRSIYDGGGPGSGIHGLYVFYKLASAAEASTYQWGGLSTTNDVLATIVALKNVVASAPFANSGIHYGSYKAGFGGDIDLSPSNRDPGIDASFALRIVAGDAGGSGTPGASWTGSTEVVDISTNNNHHLTVATDGPYTSAGDANADSSSMRSTTTGPFDALVVTVYSSSGTAPTVTSVTPAYGPVSGGETIAIVGTGFKAGLTDVEIGGVACTSVAVASATLLTCVTPAGSVGSQNVVVTTDEGSVTY